MNWKTRQAVALLVLAVLLLTLCGMPSSALAEGALLLSPDSQTFIHSLSERVSQAGSMVPDPISLSHAAGQAVFPEAAYAVSYDLRTQGKLTPVKNQNPYGTCWAFASLASLESGLMPGQSWNFSENHLVRWSGFDNAPQGFYDHGGNADMAAAYLARWQGPVNEADSPYIDPTTPSVLPVQKHVQEVLFLPPRASKLDNDNIKGALTTYGAVTVSMYWDDSYFNDATDAYYYGGGSDTNHLVAIVGWDDNYDKSRFTGASGSPSGNGAFIVRNSWGNTWGESGYFYLSYYDNVVGWFRVFNNAEAVTNFGRNYQYDPLGWVTDSGYGTNTAWFANVFTAQAGESLTAVGFYTTDVNAAYEVYMKPNFSGSSFVGPLAKSGSFATPGYHTVGFASPIPVTAGSQFCVAVKMTTPAYGFPIPIEVAVAGYSSGAASGPGQSYVSQSGSSWADITTIPDFQTANVCLKAFTAAATPVPTIGYSPSSLTFHAIQGGSNPPAQTLSIWNAGTGILNWNTGESAAWLSLNPTSGSSTGETDPISAMVDIIGLPAGTYTATITLAAAGADNSPQSVGVTLVVADLSTLTLSSPNGGEQWGIGSTQTIAWIFQGVSGNIKIELSRDGGSAYPETIATSVPVSAGSYNWTITGPASTACRVKVTSLATPSAFDTSNGNFTISEQTPGLWTNLNPSNPPSARDGHAMIYDSARGKVILFGGSSSSYFNDTWSYDPEANTWTNLNPSNPPSARYGHAMVYDAARGKVILFGGWNGSANFNDTWSYDPLANTWTNLNPSNPPSARSHHAMVYDSARGKVILFGGSSSGFLNDTWSYDPLANAWTNLNPSNPPAARDGHAMVYDTARGKVILFGGYNGSSTFNDTWSYDPPANNWTNLNPSNPPSDREGHAMIYDSARGKVILFGGVSSSGFLNDTWSYDPLANTWTNLNPSNPPAARYRHAMVYESAWEKVILFGGWNGSSDLSDQWLLNLPGGSSSLTLSSPNGGEQWGTGSTQMIAWTSQGVSGNIKIEINRNYPSGTWDSLFASVANDGSEPWVVSSPASTACRMRISSVSNPSTQDTSEGNFAILDLPPTHTVTYSLQPNWNMISLPVTPASTDPLVVFGGLPAPWYLFEWNPLTMMYVGKESISLDLGVGYWLKVPTAVYYPVSGIPNGEAQTEINLGLNWNLIGVPYQGTIPWGAVRVSKDGGALVTLDQAVSSNWIQGMFFHWSGSTYDMLSSGANFQSLFGYWVKTKVTGVQLVFLGSQPPPPPPGAAVGFP